MFRVVWEEVAAPAINTIQCILNSLGSHPGAFSFVREASGLTRMIKTMNTLRSAASAVSPGVKVLPPQGPLTAHRESVVLFQ